MKKYNRVKLDKNTGVLIGIGEELVLTRRRSIPRLQLVKEHTSEITADFIREMKTELVRELALLLNGLGPVRGQLRYEEPSHEFTNPICIDDSIVVTELSIGYVEKGFDELTETKVSQDKQVGLSISKLRSMKAGN